MKIYYTVIYWYKTYVFLANPEIRPVSFGTPKTTKNSLFEKLELLLHSNQWGIFERRYVKKKLKCFWDQKTQKTFFEKETHLTKINMGQKLLRKWILLDVFLKSCAYVLYNNRMDSCGFFCHILRHCIIFLQTDKKLEKSKSSCLFMSQKVWQNKKRWTKRSKIASKRRSDLIVSPDIYLYLYFFIPIYW